MKIVVMKVVCLLVLIGGVYMLGLVFDIGQAQLVHERVLEYWPKQDTGALNLRLPGTVAGIVLILAGLYGLVPRVPSRKGATISYKSENGDIELQLRPIRKTLLQMMNKMPEVYAIKLDVTPDADGQHACIVADVVLKNCAALGARRCSKMVTEYLATSAKNILGLDELSTIRVNIRGVRIDVTATSKQVREQLIRRTEEKAAMEPPMTPVVLEDEPTEDAAEMEDSDTQDDTATDASRQREDGEFIGETVDEHSEEMENGEDEDEGDEVKDVDDGADTTADVVETTQEHDEESVLDTAANTEDSESPPISLPPLTNDEGPASPNPEDDDIISVLKTEDDEVAPGESDEHVPEAEVMGATEESSSDLEAFPEDQVQETPEDDTTPLEDETHESRWT